MSTSSRFRRAGDRGFTLVEMLIAMALLTIVMLSALPALIGVTRSATITRDQTRAKNLTQQRMEQIRDLPFHVDRQNGPFLDLLDIYYTHALSGSGSTSVASGGSTLTGTYVPAGAAAVAGEPTAPYFRVTTGPLPGNAGFSQTITTQFLDAAGQPLAAARFEGTSAGSTGYTSQVAGRDAPPSLVVQVVVRTDWTQAGRAKSYFTRTRITDGRPERPVIQSQARTVALALSSTAADGSTLALQAGVATLDGAQSSGSTVSGFATGASATRSGQATVTGQVGTFALPASPVSVSGSTASVNPAGCGWYAFGASATSNVSGDVGTGLPKAPANVDTTTPPQVMSGSLRANGNPACGVVSYDNLAGGGLARSDALGVTLGAAPYVRIPNPSGSADVVAGSGYVTSNALTSVPQKTSSGVRASITQPVILFPNSPGLGGQGLVQLSLTTAQVDCGSGGTSSGATVTGGYTGLQLRWWGRTPSEAAARWHAATWSYSGTGVPALASGGETWDPTNTFVPRWNGTAFDYTAGTTLSQLVTVSVPSASSGVLTESATSGQRGFPGGILNLSTVSTLANETVAGYSAIKLSLGQLSCVADDER